MQNIVLLMDPSQDEFKPNYSFRSGNMYLNRFCIDEDAAFESSPIYHLWDGIFYRFEKNPKPEGERKGTEYSGS